MGIWQGLRRKLNIRLDMVVGVGLGKGLRMRSDFMRLETGLRI